MSLKTMKVVMEEVIEAVSTDWVAYLSQPHFRRDGQRSAGCTVWTLSLRSITGSQWGFDLMLRDTPFSNSIDVTYRAAWASSFRPWRRLYDCRRGTYYAAIDPPRLAAELRR